ncbi:MAG TPA: chemotaxis protein CheW [Bryobacteraceae bacterium]|nr:chemotaxis protein CheW [Bryobacteraceae bacterium]
MQSALAVESRGAMTPAADPRAGKYLTFKLGEEEFGVRVVKVREIMGIQPVTAVPQTPEYLKGVLNLRGKVIPVIDLRLKFGMPAIEYSQRTCIVVVQVEADTGSILVGLVVDAVSEVLMLAGSDIEDTPDFGVKVSTPFLLGMAKLKGKVKILLDIDRVVSEREIAALDTIVSNSGGD